MACSREDIEKVFNAMLAGASLNTALTNCSVSRWQFFNTIDSNSHLALRYARAQQVRAELLADEVVDIADNEVDAQKARNRIDVRKWYASKMQPQKYGERLDVNVNQTIDIGTALQDARKRAALPSSYPDEIEDAQLVDNTALPAPDTTGSKPDDDIFS